ncbi:MAG: YkgJ family cysteine cluster protein, partial [Lachnospiraceae bacterium]|nr:YkgJ family cysteine cluster protein [Lachnospiraceae bacterium]
TAVGCTFRDGYGKLFELRVVDGITLPYLLKSKETEDCILLSGGRCRIHAHRPGFCRLFPLGRMYNETGFDYFLQTGQCRCGKTKPVTVREWLGIPDLEEYERYIQSWHDLTEKCQKDAMQAATSGESRKAANAEYILGISMKLLNAFFIPPYDTNTPFYEQYYKRLNALDQK